MPRWFMVYDWLGSPGFNSFKQTTKIQGKPRIIRGNKKKQQGGGVLFGDQERIVEEIK